jgi:hypothetical protein
LDGWKDEHRKERVVKNEVAYREHNQRRAEFERGAVQADDAVPFVCECGMPDCAAGIVVSVEAWEEVHADPDRFVIRDGHQFPEYERVVEALGDYLIVEKVEPVGERATT